MFIPLHDQNALKDIHLHYVTLGLIVANVVVWLITATWQVGDVVQANTLYYAYGFIPAVANGVSQLPPEIAVLPASSSYITYAFLHADFMHLAGNMLFLWVFGDNVEDALGHFRFLIFYLACAAASAWAHAFMFPASEVPLVGASGAAAGVVGAYLMLHPRVKVWVLVLGRIPLRLSAMWVLGAWIAFQVFNVAFNADAGVSWVAHIGGFVAGTVLVVLLKRRSVALFDADLAAADSAGSSSGDKGSGRAKAAKNPQRWGRGE